MRWIGWTAGGTLALALGFALAFAPASATERSLSLAPGESAEFSAASGGFGYTLQLISPLTQTQVPVNGFSAPYFFLLLTNDAPTADTFHLAVRSITQPWFAQVCLRQICFPDSTDLVFNAGTADTIGVQVIPFFDGVGEWDFIVSSAGDPGLSDTLHMTLHAGAAATDAPNVATSLDGYELRQNVPNPVVDHTAISFSLPREDHVALGVFDVGGRLVADLDSGLLPAGPHTVRWDGRSNSGARVPGGVYFYRLRTAAGELSKRMTLIR